MSIPMGRWGHRWAEVQEGSVLQWTGRISDLWRPGSGHLESRPPHRYWRCLLQRHQLGEINHGRKSISPGT